MSTSLRVMGFFEGIGGFRLGLERAGHRFVGACEIAKAPRQVYAARFGHEPQFGDIRGIKAHELPEADLWCGGFPCQDLSSAGDCAGIDGARSGLVWDLLRLAADVRPGWIVLENVDGALVRGRGWGRLPRALAELGYLGAYRVLDARGFAVPQRRRRVFVVARRLGAGGGCPGCLLLQPQGVRRDPESCEAPGQVVAGALTAGAGGRRGGGDEFGVARCITTREGQRQDSSQTYVYGFNGWTGCTGDAPLLDASPTLAAGRRAAGRRAAVLFSNGSTANAAGRLTDAASTQLADGHRPTSGNGGTIVFDSRQTAVLYRNSQEAGAFLSDEAAPLLAQAQALSRGSRLCVAVGPYVRMLTVTECERVMGFPDGWTHVEWTTKGGKTKTLSDTARRKCLGNAVVPSVIEWIGRRLAAVPA